jgi:SM-20-related protein
MTDSSQIPPLAPVLDPFQALSMRLARGLHAADAVVVPSAWDPVRCARMRDEGVALAAAGALAPAAIGHGAQQTLDATQRGDRTAWLDALDPARAPTLHALSAELDALRAALNRTLLLGLEEVEAHLACYPPGAGYARHRDRFADHDARVLSLVLYLNDDWRPAHGGALRLHLAAGPHDVLPASGTLVAFLSDRVEHEVRPATRERWSVAAWFRRRGAPIPDR